MGSSVAIIAPHPDLLGGIERVGAALADTIRSARSSGAGAATDPGGDDDALLRAVADGNNAAFGTLMERHLGRVFSLALRITGSRSDAEDAAQEVFSRVWRKAPDWEPGAARFSTWLYRVTMNLCIDARRRPRMDQLDPDLPIVDPGANVVDRMIAGEREQQVRQAMAELPERQRQAMALCYTMGLSNAAAADAMEISVKAYEALLVRAKREMRAKLEGSEP